MTFDLSSPAVSIPSFTLTVHVWWIMAWIAVGFVKYVVEAYAALAVLQSHGRFTQQSKWTVPIVALRRSPKWLLTIASGPFGAISTIDFVRACKQHRQGERA